MAFPGRHVDASNLLGSWPVIPSIVGGVPVFLPRTMQSKATIIGIAKEPAAGYDVDGRSFFLNVDGSVKTINFSYGAPLPLSEVISQINSDVTFTVAYNDNGFLRLQSPTSGGDSYLKVLTDPSSSPTDVLKNLGLFAETEAYAGDLTQSQHVDPDRQVATPGQMSMSEGENFEARVVNRALAQLAFNNDRNEGLLSKQRVAVRNSHVEVSYAVPGAVDGVQFSGGKLVYVGKQTAPSKEQLKSLFTVLDSEGRELSYDAYYPIATGLVGDFSMSVDGMNRLICTSAAWDSYTEAFLEKYNYVIASGLTGDLAALNGLPLKITEVVLLGGPTSYVAVENMDQSGVRHTGSTSSVTFTLGQRELSRVLVDGVYPDVAAAAAGTPRLENNQVVKRSGLTPTRIDLSNRIVCVGQNFTSTPAIQIGDLVTWSGSTVQAPFNNNGDYRVNRIIDKETIEVVAADWSAAFINPITVGGVGTITIKNDGAFVLDPFLRFYNGADPSVGMPPVPGESLSILYLKGTSIRQAAQDNPALFEPDLKYDQEADETIQRAITGMWGPSVSSVDDVLYQDYRINLEYLNSRLNTEHYGYDDAEKTYSPYTQGMSYGRHKDIKADSVYVTTGAYKAGTGYYGAYLTNLTGSVPGYTRYGLLIDDVSGGDTNYALLTKVGRVEFRDSTYLIPPVTQTWHVPIPTPCTIVHAAGGPAYDAWGGDTGTPSLLLKSDSGPGAYVETYMCFMGDPDDPTGPYTSWIGSLYGSTPGIQIQAKQTTPYGGWVCIRGTYVDIEGSDVTPSTGYVRLSGRTYIRFDVGGSAAYEMWSSYLQGYQKNLGSDTYRWNTLYLNKGIHDSGADVVNSTTSYTHWYCHPTTVKGVPVNVLTGCIIAPYHVPNDGQPTGNFRGLSVTPNFMGGTGEDVGEMISIYVDTTVSTGTATDIYGIFIDSLYGVNSTVKCGLHIEDQTGPAFSYAIRTNLGKVSFGDLTSVSRNWTPTVTSDSFTMFGSSVTTALVSFNGCTLVGGSSWATGQTGSSSAYALASATGFVARGQCSSTTGLGTAALYGLQATCGNLSGSVVNSATAILVTWDLNQTLTGNQIGLNISACNKGATASVCYAILTSTGQVKFGDGLVMGSPTGGNLGVGTINVATNIYKNNSAYTNPDYVLELAFTGKIDKYRGHEGAKDYHLMSLEEVEAFAKEHLRLPRIEDKPTGIFTMADIALEKIEELYLHMFEKDRQIKQLRDQLAVLEQRLH